MNPATLGTTSSPSGIAPQGRLRLFVSGLGRSVAGFARAIAHRREVVSLLELDDRALKDIGLARADVVGALSLPVTRDPSVLLRLRAVERRAVRRVALAPSGPVRRRVEA